MSHLDALQATAFMARLRAELHDAGAFRGDTAGYVCKSLYVVALTAAVWWGLSADPIWPVRALLWVVAGYAGVQAAAIAHEAGHAAVSRNLRLNGAVGHVFMTLIVGASYTAWRSRHGRHHLHPNSSKDPDVHPWIFSFNEADARASAGLRRWFTQRQHLLLFPLSTLMGFSLKLSGWRHALVQRSPDRALLVLHAALWIVVPAAFIGWSAAATNYAMLTWVEGAYLSFVFLANHLGGPTGEDAAAWPPALRQVVTARNLPASRLFTHVCIGLNTHIEHHLFGHLPPSRLLEVRETTRRLCTANGIPYRECGVVEAFVEVHRHSRRMSAIAGRKEA